MSDNFIDLSYYIFTQPWFWAAVVSLVLAVVLTAAWTMDDNDRKLERMERVRSENLRAKLSAKGDEESILTQFFDTGDLPKERMERLSTPTDHVLDGPFSKLLDHYKLSAHVDGDKQTVVLTDRKHFNLRNRTYGLSLEKIVGADYEQLRQMVANARYTLNRRAKRAGGTAAVG